MIKRTSLILVWLVLAHSGCMMFRYDYDQSDDDREDASTQQNFPDASGPGTVGGRMDASNNGAGGTGGFGGMDSGLSGTGGTGGFAGSDSSIDISDDTGIGEEDSGE